MKKLIKNLIPPSKRLILVSCIMLAFTSVTRADHDDPTLINVWIEKGPENTTKYNPQEIAVCCGEPELFRTSTSIRGNTRFTWQGVGTSSDSSVVHNQGSANNYPSPSNFSLLQYADTQLVFKESGVFGIWTTVQLGTYTEQTNHEVIVTSQGTRFKHYEEDTSKWGSIWNQVNWSTDTPYYWIHWVENESFDPKGRLASPAPAGTTWKLYKYTDSSRSSGTYVSGISTSTGVISFASGNVTPGYYQVQAEDDGSDCVARLDLDILKIEFETFSESVPGPGKPHFINMETKQNESQHYGEFEKCTSHVWTGSAIKSASYLAGYQQQKDFYENPNHLKWIVNGTSQPTHSITPGVEPAEGRISAYEVEVIHAKENVVLDRLIVTVIPQATLEAFNVWYADNVDMSWTAELPDPYVGLSAGSGPYTGYYYNPEPYACYFWQGPSVGEPFSIADTKYHPDGYYEMRSHPTPSGHGHQAFYNENGTLIQSGLSAGSADYAAPSFFTTDHRNKDVHPFIWAIQIDGSPTEAGSYTVPTSLTKPIMHDGVYAKRYLERRPPIVSGAGLLMPNTCP